VADRRERLGRDGADARVGVGERDLERGAGAPLLEVPDRPGAHRPEERLGVVEGQEEDARVAEGPLDGAALQFVEPVGEARRGFGRPVRGPGAPGLGSGHAYPIG
jgi:hypothetical protein